MSTTNESVIETCVVCGKGLNGTGDEDLDFNKYCSKECKTFSDEYDAGFLTLLTKIKASKEPVSKFYQRNSFSYKDKLVILRNFYALCQDMQVMLKENNIDNDLRIYLHIPVEGLPSVSMFAK